MTGPDALDETADDHERLETELLVQDRDAAWVSTADIDETTARQAVNELVDDGAVTAIAEQRVLVSRAEWRGLRLNQPAGRLLSRVDGRQQCW